MPVRIKAAVSGSLDRVASWILDSQEHKGMKALVVVWVVISSVFTPVCTVGYPMYKDRQDARRIGLQDTPRLDLHVAPDGTCLAHNPGPRPLRNLEIRRFVHRLPPEVDCDDPGSLHRTRPDVFRSSFEAGSTLKQPLPEPVPGGFLPCTEPTPCSALIECEATFYREADLARFERVAFAGVSQRGLLHESIVSVTSEEKRFGGGSRYSFRVADRWQPLFACAQDRRETRREMWSLMDTFSGVHQEAQQKK